MTKKMKPMTAAEFMAQKESDPEWVEKRRRREEKDRERREALDLAQAPVVEDLRSAGFPVKSVWDLVNTPGSYPQAIPVLLKHLERPYPDPVREGIARALAVPESRDAGWSLLVRLFRAEPPGQFRQGLAVAIAESADDDVLEEVIDLLRDKNFGTNRILLLPVLERSRKPEVLDILSGLKEDPDLEHEVQKTLRRIKRAKR